MKGRTSERTDWKIGLYDGEAMRSLKLVLVLSALGVTCAASAAQQPKIFDWQPANDETVRMDPANYYTAQTYRPAASGGSMHVEITAERPVAVFMTDAMSWQLALQHPENISSLRTSCVQEHIMQTTYVCTLPEVPMTLVIHDERRNPAGAAFAGFAAVIRPEERADHALETGVEAARIGERLAERRFFAANDVHIEYYLWD